MLADEPYAMMSLLEEDVGMSMLARTRFVLVKFFLLLISREPRDRMRDQSATEGHSRVPECPLNHLSSYTYNILNPSVTSTSRAVPLVVLNNDLNVSSY